MRDGWSARLKDETGMGSVPTVHLVVYAAPTRNGFALVGKEAVFGIHGPDSGGTPPAILFVEDTMQIDRHQIADGMRHLADHVSFAPIMISSL